MDNFEESVLYDIETILQRNQKEEVQYFVFFETFLNIKKIIKEYKNTLTIKYKKTAATETNKAIDILKRDIEELEKIYFNTRLSKYLEKTKIKHNNPNEVTIIDSGLNYNGLAYANTEVEVFKGDIFLILQDLYNIKNYVISKKGTKSVKEIINNVKLNKIDDYYISLLYHTPKIDLKKKIIKIISTQNQYDKNIIKEIESYFNSYTYAKHYNSLINSIK
jgi:hypothetical protein